MPLNMQPLSDRFGVSITGVDLSKELDEKLFDEIVDVFVKKQVLVFRNQHIEPQHQVAFSRRFGPLEMLYDEDQRVPGFPEVAILSNEKVDGKFIGVVAAGDFWHSDQSYRRETSLATLLYAHKLPKHGGDTEFADMHGAYESLPDEIKKRIEGRMGIHQRSKLGNPRVAVTREGGEEYYQRRPPRTCSIRLSAPIRYRVARVFMSRRVLPSAFRTWTTLRHSRCSIHYSLTRRRLGTRIVTSGTWAIS